MQRFDERALQRVVGGGDEPAKPLPTDEGLQCGATTIALPAILVARTVITTNFMETVVSHQDMQIGGDLLLGAILLVPVVVFIFRKHINWGTGTGRHDFDLPDRSDSSTPAFNTDGTAMCGGFDAHGNAYGVRRIEWDR